MLSSIITQFIMVVVVLGTPAPLNPRKVIFENLLDNRYNNIPPQSRVSLTFVEMINSLKLTCSISNRYLIYLIEEVEIFKHGP